ncbi:Wzz/FepE/Etk N-terminal domain-containing protein [Streptomyces sp. CA-288835]|uniref:Wzz/FepE/Etk N-terminal domain-containing protein n=1 Tax=Streptomyces sp. CA-288835 TaxID=3240069 RepID=UPI003D8F0C9E
MDLGSYLRLLRRRWVAILLLAILGTLGGTAVAWVKNPLYAAKTDILVTAASPRADLSQSYQGALLAEELTQSYSVLLTSEPVLRTLIDELRLPYSVEKLRSEIKASHPRGTAVVKVTVEDRSPQRAKVIADAIGPTFTKVLASADAADTSSDTAGDRSDVKVGVLPQAASSGQLVPPHKSLDIVVGLIVGLVLGAAWSVGRAIMDPRIHDARDVVETSDIPVLAVVPRDKATRGKALLQDTQRPPSVVEAYRTVAVNLRSSVSSGIQRHAYVITGIRGSENSAATAAGIAIALAQDGYSVILVDADPLDMRLAQSMELSQEIGLRDVLANRASLDAALQEWHEDLPLRVLAGGLQDQRSVTPLRERSLDPLCAELERRADVVIFASPPVLTRTDGVALARVTGQAVIVAQTKVTRGDELDTSVQTLRAVGVTVLGVVLNDVTRRRGRRQVWPAPRERIQTSADSTHEAAPRGRPVDIPDSDGDHRASSYARKGEP